MDAKKNKLKIFADMMLNICASAMPIVLLQLFILPGVARVLGDVQYGLMMTLVSLTSMVSLALGNTLNNVRLLKQNEYKCEEQSGDFNYLLVALTLVNSLIIVLVTGLYTEWSVYQIVYTLLASIVMLYREYVSVWFRLQLDYKELFINSLVLLAGHVIGYFVFIAIGVWQAIYIVSYFLSTVHILFKHNFVTEPWRKTPKFHARINDSVTLSMATVLSSALSYIDKLFLFPLLGGAAVSVYYAATIIGKMSSMLVNPISSVMLSYIAKLQKFKRALFFKMLLLVGLLSTVAYFFCLFVSEPILNWLYPDWSAEALEIINITTATAMISLAISVLNPVILKFCSLNRQVTINFISLVLYSVLCPLLLKISGLAGFALGVLVSMSIKFMLIIGVYLKEYKPD